MADKVISATGRRKTSVARVFLRAGKGNISINARSLQEYFGRETARMIVLQPFDVTQTAGTVDIDVNVVGGGSSGQAGAIRHGIARALIQFNPIIDCHLRKRDLLPAIPAPSSGRNTGATKRASVLSTRNVNSTNSRLWRGNS